MKQFILLLVLCCFLAGCKAGPGRSAGFIDGDQIERHDNIPFHGAWIKAGFDKEWYDKIYIAPVDTSYLLTENNWWQNSFRYSQIEQDAEKIAEYARESFKKAFTEAENNRYILVETPVEKTLIFEMAITELTPNKPFLKVASYTPFFIGTGVKVINQSNPSIVAFEARVKDGESGEIIATFADREKEKSSFVSKDHFSWYGHAEEIIDDWAMQFVLLANKKPDEIIKDSESFKLSPW